MAATRPAVPVAGLSTYRPPLLFRHPHLQSALAGSGLRRRIVERNALGLLAASEDFIIGCGGDIRLLAHHTPPAGDSGRVAVLLHGWEGSGRSLHVLSAAVRLWREGYRIVRINLRDHGDSHHLNSGIFHSCLLDEMVDAVRAVHERYPAEELCLAGFSLGGNFALRIASVPGADTGISRVVAVCPVLDPEETMQALDGGSPIYRRYFLARWRRSLERKAALFPDLYDFGSLDRFRTLRDMTDYFVTRYTEFPDLLSYLRGYAITGDRLATLRVPASLLVAEDDPVIPVSALDRVARPPLLEVRTSRFGGHCGFFADYRLRTWLDDYLVTALSSY